MFHSGRGLLRSAARSRVLAAAAPAGAAAAPAATLQILAMLQAKDAELIELHAELKAERGAMDAELKAEREAKDAELKAERGAKDAEQKAHHAELTKLLVELGDLRLISQRDARALADALYAADTARSIIGVRAVLEVVIDELWSLYGGGNKTQQPTDRLRMLAKGMYPPLMST